MFDTMPETRTCGPVLGKNSVSGAVLFHGLVLSALVGASVLARVPAGDPPPLPGTPVFFGSPLRFGLDLEPGGGGAHAPAARKESPASQKPRDKHDWTQPARIEEVPGREESSEVQLSDASREDSPWQGGDGGGPGDGSGGGAGDGSGDGGVPWGWPDGDRIGPPPPDPGEILVVGGPVEAPVLIRKVEPEYPSIARRAGIQGVVVLEGVIGIDGRIESLAVTHSIRVLDRAALEAVKQWLYTPARMRDSLVRVRVTIRVEFRMD